MPTPNPTTRREYKGAAAASTLQTGITNAALSLVLTSSNNWPTGAVGSFIITVDRGQASEEKMLCSAQTSGTVTVVTRGFDGTTAQAHNAGATVECTISAFDADEWNQHTNATSGVHGVAGTVVGTTDAQTLTNKTLTAPVVAQISNTGTLTLPTSTDTLVGRATTDTLTNKTLTGAVLDGTSTLGGIACATLSGAWTAYTPTLTNVSNYGGAFAYKLIGKTLFLRGEFLGASGPTATGTVSFSLPAGLTSVVGVSQMVNCSSVNSSTQGGIWTVAANSTVVSSGTAVSGALIGVMFFAAIEVQ